MNNILTDTIYETETGRRYYIKAPGNWLCGYVEIDADMPKNYDDEFYEQFDFWGGATYLGVCFPSADLGTNTIIQISATIPIDGSYLNGTMANPSLADVINQIKEEYRERFSAYRDSFWIIGYDDNHLDQCYDVPDRTKHIAEQMDEFVKNNNQKGEL